MATIRFKINGKSVTLKSDEDRMLLWMLRTDLALTGVKYGCGEPAITPMGPVIANEVYDAIGIRLYELPMTPTRIKKAIKNNSDSLKL